MLDFLGINLYFGESVCLAKDTTHRHELLPLNPDSKTQTTRPPQMLHINALQWSIIQNFDARARAFTLEISL